MNELHEHYKISKTYLYEIMLDSIYLNINLIIIKNDYCKIYATNVIDYLKLIFNIDQ